MILHASNVNIGFYTNQNTYSLCLLLFKLVIFYILIYLYSFPFSSNVMVELLIFIDLEEQVKNIYSTYYIT